MTPDQLLTAMLGRPIGLGTEGALLVRARDCNHTAEAIAECIRQVAGRTDILVVGLAGGEDLTPLADFVPALAEHLRREGLEHPDEGVFLTMEQAEWVSRTAFRWLMRPPAR